MGDMYKAINQELGSRENSPKLEITEPLLLEEKLSGPRIGESESSNGEGWIWMVLFTTIVAICGSYEYGSCMGYSAPAQTGIMDDLNISLSQYSVFGSILPIGGMIGAVTSGSIADFIGRREGVLLLDLGRFSTGYGAGILSYVVCYSEFSLCIYLLQLLVCWGTASAT